MTDLSSPLTTELRDLVREPPYNIESLRRLVNTVIDDATDYEHLITFLSNSHLSIYRNFADEMKAAFEKVLRGQLESIRQDIGDHPTELYDVLIDLHNIPDCPESLSALLTTNYDEYIEAAIESVTNCPPNFGITVEGLLDHNPSPTLLKLHGSLGWYDTWPISTQPQTGETVWIPPGIQKTKQSYPFNILWGLAEELLNCDILRVIGCRLAPNDWDLISLLFTMRHTNFPTLPTIEIVDSPRHAEELKCAYPYLELRSMLEVEPLGSRLVAAVTGLSPIPYYDLTDDQLSLVLDPRRQSQNWFEIWLTEKIELLFEDLSTVDTNSGIVDRFMSRN